MIIVINPKGPSTQIVGFQGPKTIQGMDVGHLKPYYLGTRSLWVIFITTIIVVAIVIVCLSCPVIVYSSAYLHHYCLVLSRSSYHYCYDYY